MPNDALFALLATVTSPTADVPVEAFVKFMIDAVFCVSVLAPPNAPRTPAVGNVTAVVPVIVTVLPKAPEVVKAPPKLTSPPKLTFLAALPKEVESVRPVRFSPWRS